MITCMNFYLCVIFPHGFPVICAWTFSVIARVESTSVGSGVVNWCSLHAHSLHCSGYVQFCVFLVCFRAFFCCFRVLILCQLSCSVPQTPESWSSVNMSRYVWPVTRRWDEIGMAGVVGRGGGGVGELVAVQNGVIVNTTKCHFVVVFCLTWLC